MQGPNLEDTILVMVHHYSDPKDLLKAVRKAHPGASKKDIIHAVFSTMIEAAASDEGVAQRLHVVAMDHRAKE